jgi:hypothetical protein
LLLFILHNEDKLNLQMKDECYVQDMYLEIKFDDDLI